MQINHNIAALNTYNKLNANQSATAKSLEKLSSGLKINKAGDDAAGLAISEKMRGQIRGLDQASANAADGISLIKTAEGGLSETHSILQRMRELSVQSANDTNVETDRGEIQKEMDQLSKEITRISTDTEFNTKNLLNGDAGTKVSASNTSVGKFAADDDTVAGDYSFTGMTVATGANATSSASLSGTTSGVSTLNINGTDFAFASGSSSSDITTSINARTATTGVAATIDGSGKLLLTSNKVGEDVTLTATGTGDTALGSVVAGTDATVTTGTAGTATIKGNDVEYTTGNMKGLKFTVAASGASTVSVDTENALKMQIGANAEQNMTVSINNMSAEALGVGALDVTSQSSADIAITTIDDAIGTVSSERAKLGAYQNRLEHTINNLSTSSENTSASESRIRDVDMAKEMMEFTKNNILSQAAQSMLAQANQQPQGVLQLLQ